MADYPIPGAGVYGQAVNLAKSRYQQRVADLNKQRQSTFRSSGFQGDINADTGLVSNMRTDPNNMYGAYQQLNRAQAQQSMQTEDESIGRGLGTGGGLAAQRMADTRYQSGQQDAQFGASLLDTLGGFDRSQQDSKYEYDMAMYQAQLEAARAAIEGGDFAPGGDGDYAYSSDYDYSSGVEESAGGWGEANSYLNAALGKLPANPWGKKPKTYPTSKPLSRPSGNPMHRPRVVVRKPTPLPPGQARMLAQQKSKKKKK